MEANKKREPFEERHFTVPELAKLWCLSREFVRQVVQHEPGVTEWVRQQPGRRRYRVLRVPQSVAERLYNRALGKAEECAAHLSIDIQTPKGLSRHGALAAARRRRRPRGAQPSVAGNL
jgi:hypothetical protein